MKKVNLSDLFGLAEAFLPHCSTPEQFHVAMR
jgi:hypothetical protein